VWTQHRGCLRTTRREPARSSFIIISNAWVLSPGGMRVFGVQQEQRDAISTSARALLGYLDSLVRTRHELAARCDFTYRMTSGPASNALSRKHGRTAYGYDYGSDDGTVWLRRWRRLWLWLRLTLSLMFLGLPVLQNHGSWSGCISLVSSLGSRWAPMSGRSRPSRHCHHPGVRTDDERGAGVRSHGRPMTWELAGYESRASDRSRRLPRTRHGPEGVQRDDR
jgi:hypothetical protein